MKARFPIRFYGRARPPGAPLFCHVRNGIGRDRRSRPTNDRATSAFSLVEVAVAVAVIAIGLLVVIGLFPQGLQSARDAADNTLSATIAQNLFGQLRNGDFTIYICTDPSDLGYPIHCNSPTYQLTVNFNSAPWSQSFYFDQEGLLTNGLAAYYQVNLQWATEVLGNPDLMLVQATVVWPAYYASPTPINTNIFITEIARYNNP